MKISYMFLRNFSGSSLLSSSDGPMASHVMKSWATLSEVHVLTGKPMESSHLSSDEALETPGEGRKLASLQHEH